MNQVYDLRGQLAPNFVADFRDRTFEVFRRELRPVPGIESVLDAIAPGSSGRATYGGLIREFLAHLDRRILPAARISALVEAHADAPIDHQ